MPSGRVLQAIRELEGMMAAAELQAGGREGRLTRPRLLCYDAAYCQEPKHRSER
jgi:hypothetical protein